MTITPPNFSQDLKDKMVHIGRSSTSHGVSNYLRTNRPQFKCMWLTCFMVSSTIWILSVVQVMTLYFSYPVTTRIRFIDQAKVDFPTIAICNSNPYMTNASVDFLIDYFERYTNYSYSNSNITKLEFLNDLFLNDSSQITNLSYNNYNLNESIKKSFGLSFSEQFISCHFGGNLCTLDDFKWFYDYNYGNCYAFNPFNPNGKTYDATRDGILNGLTVELFAGFEPYVPDVNNYNGYKIVVYNKSEDDLLVYNFERFSVKTNTEFFIALSRVFVNNLPKPYSNCDIDLTCANENSWDSFIYRKLYNSGKVYRQKNCYEYYAEKISYEECGCIFFKDGDKKFCTTPEEVACSFSIYRNANSPEFISKRKPYCPLECNSVFFKAKTSIGNYPSDVVAKHLIKTNEIFKDVAAKRPLTIAEVKASTAKVNVYYEHLHYEVLDEIETINITNLFAKIGGMLGLFLGMSCLSFIEVFELLLELVIMIFKNPYSTKKVNVDKEKDPVRI